jgi:hypothetical protein
MATMAGIRSWIATHRLQSETLALSILGLVVFTTLGLRARKQAEPMRAEQIKLKGAQTEVAMFRSQFKSSSPALDLRIAQLTDSLSVALPREQRVALAQRIAAEADAIGLSDVRVRFATPDSSAAPARPDLVRSPVTTADYSIAVDCYGGFANVLSLVNRLPASVAVQRIIGVDVNGRAHFEISLAVFEASPAPEIRVSSEVSR